MFNCLFENTTHSYKNSQFNKCLFSLIKKSFSAKAEDMLRRCCRIINPVLLKKRSTMALVAGTANNFLASFAIDENSGSIPFQKRSGSKYWSTDLEASWRACFCLFKRLFIICSYSSSSLDTSSSSKRTCHTFGGLFLRTSWKKEYKLTYDSCCCRVK